MVTSESDLPRQVKDGGFLRKLYYRLSVLQLRVPPLRERQEDIPLLARHFLEKGKRRGNGNNHIKSFSGRAMLALLQHDWPTNVEELKVLIEDILLKHKGPQIDLNQLPPIFSCKEHQSTGKDQSLDHNSRGLPLREAKRIFEIKYYKDLLRRTHGNMALASKTSMVGRPYL